jgi:hypothetical protein
MENSLRISMYWGMNPVMIKKGAINTIIFATVWSDADSEESKACVYQNMLSGNP